jgi:hypothetical protein
MGWSDEYVNIWCPTCHGDGMVPNVDGSGSIIECETCGGLRMVRVPENKLRVYDPDPDDD